MVILIEKLALFNKELQGVYCILKPLRTVISSVKLIQDDLQSRKQRFKVGIAYSNWQDILAVVPQGSILGPILFNIFLFDLFLDQGNNYFTDYVNDTTPYLLGDNTADVPSGLTKITQE